ncbi:MAG TPA: 3-methyl-2-oxobutanoate hydroxymethyltransferase, partial [Deltaproteobacteria bacterium]|nr:3-methyl-2-oxobutanoate hydroxymethyltransferase [Deltaproteobacteria bacterium]
GVEIVDTVKRLVDSGIPVMGHLGLTPQSIHQLGGYGVQGKEDEAAKKMIDDAIALEEAGIFSLVLECVPTALAKGITEQISVPTIGIGAGVYCDGQVLVTHDLLGIFEKFVPKFVKRYVELNKPIKEAVNRFIEEVQQGKFPGPEHSFGS